MHSDAAVDSWVDGAACRGRPQSWFFPPDGRGPAVANWRVDVRPLALATCAVCPVKAECLEDAHAHGEEAGVWGGVDFGIPSVRRTRTPRRTAPDDLRRALDDGARARIAHLRAHGASARTIASLFGVTERSVYRYLEATS